MLLYPNKPYATVQYMRWIGETSLRKGFDHLGSTVYIHSTYL